MANLLDQLRQTQTQRAQTPVGGQTRRLEKALEQRATGKAFGSRGPRASGAMERAALAQQSALADQQQARAQQAAQASQIQQAGQEQQFRQGTQQIAQRQTEQAAQFNRQADQIANDLKRKDLSRATEKELFDLAQLGAAQALQDKQYLDELNREGQRRRLNDEISFKQELQQSILGEQEEMFRDQQAFRKMMDMDNDEFAREISKMDIATADSLVRADVKAANDRAVYEGLSGILSGGLGAYAQYAKPSANNNNDIGLTEDELYAGEDF